MSFIIQPAAAGASVQGTASGAVAANKPMVVNADGTFSQAGLAASTTTLTASTNTDTVTTSGMTQPCTVYDPVNNKYVIFFESGYGAYYAIGTSNGSTITWGSTQSFPTTGSVVSDQSLTATYHAASGCIIFTYYHDDGVGRISAKAGTISGTSLTFGTEVTIYNLYPVGGSYATATYDSIAQKVVFFYCPNGVGSTATVIGCTAGRVITAGTATTFDGNNCFYMDCCFDSTNGKVVYVYRPNAAGYKQYYIVGTVTGTSIAFGTATIFYNASSYVSQSGKGVVYDPSKNRIVIYYNDGTNNVLQAGQVSGTTITFGTAVNTGITGVDNYSPTLVYDTNQSQSALFYTVANVSYKVLAFTLSGSVITIGNSSTIYASSTTSFLNAVWDTTYLKFLSIYYDVTSTYQKDRYVFYGTFNLTSENFIGFSVAAVSTGATVTVSTVGGSDTGQSGLTPGQSYYVQLNGTLSQTQDSPIVYAGLAYAATKILIGNGS